MEKIGEKKLFKALLDPMLEAQLETQEKSNLLKEKTVERKKSKAKSMEPRPSPFSDLKPKTQLYLCNLGAKIPVHCLFINSRTQKRKKRKRKRRITGN